jgi:glycine betaine/proline transport system permease protein
MTDTRVEAPAETIQSASAQMADKETAGEKVKRIAKKRSTWLLLVIVVWIIAGTVFSGFHTMRLGTMQTTAASEVFSSGVDYVRANRSTNPVFVYAFNPLRVGVESFVGVIRSVISNPARGNVIPLIGWLGVLAVAGFLTFITSTWRTALLVMTLLFGTGVLGMWVFTMDTLALTLGSVILSLAIGFPLGVWAGLNDRVMAALRPILDLAQTLPILVYLAPLALVFLIGVAAATIATMVYAIPICIRITAHAIRSLPKSPVEAANSLGSTRLQLLRKVQIPIARRTLILGVNQTTMAALSFVVIAAIIGAPGLGKPVINALMVRDVGGGIIAGAAVVFLAIALDRATTAAVAHSESFVELEGPARIRRRIAVVAAGIATIVAIVLSRQQLWAAVFPVQLDFGRSIASATQSGADWVTDTFSFFTVTFNQQFTVGFLNPLENLLVDTPWYITVIAISLIAAILGGRNATIISVVLLTVIVVIGLWNDTMVTLTQVLVATSIVMLIGVILGVAAGRSPKFERALKPFLDAGQTLPAFVYLVPVLALFGPTRFAAIVCGIFYATPVVVRVVADGVRRVPSDMVEAATSAGSTRAQIITKVQLPASKRALLLGVNQGLIFVLAVIVIGAYVGAGGLGYLVIAGLSKPELQGKGLAAGLAIVLLGVVLDRIAQATANRTGKPVT